MSFSEVPQHALPISPHSRHVAVNFVDLGVLEETLIAHEHQAAPDSACMCQAPDAVLTWVGMERSAFVCAKTLVILHMVRRGSTAANVVQVHSPLVPPIPPTTPDHKR